MSSTEPSPWAAWKHPTMTLVAFVLLAGALFFTYQTIQAYDDARHLAKMELPTRKIAYAAAMDHGFRVMVLIGLSAVCQRLSVK